MEYERAHRTLAARETATHRAAKVNDGRSDLDPGVSGGQLRFGPRGHGSATLARSDARTGSSTFWQRGRGGGPTAPGGQPGGPVRGAITGAGTTRATGGAGALVGINKRRATKDTLAHEFAHDWVNRFLQESGVRRAKGIYAGREGTAGVSRRAGRPSSGKALTVDEQEWLANQFVEYLRQGEDAIAHPSLRPLAAHYAGALRKNAARGDLHPEARAFFDEIDARPKPPKGYTYDVDEQAMVNEAAIAHRRADRMAQDLIHFRSSRSWLERSLNHPYFGLYPLSYMPQTTHRQCRAAQTPLSPFQALLVSRKRMEARNSPHRLRGFE